MQANGGCDDALGLEQETGHQSRPQGFAEHDAGQRKDR